MSDIESDNEIKEDNDTYEKSALKPEYDSDNISEIEQYGSRIYPNPANYYINVVSKNKINRLEIYDLLGKKLLEKDELDISRIRLPMSNHGIYMVKLFSESGVENHWIIKK